MSKNIRTGSKLISNAESPGLTGFGIDHTTPKTRAYADSGMVLKRKIELSAYKMRCVCFLGGGVQLSCILYQVS